MRRLLSFRLRATCDADVDDPGVGVRVGAGVLLLLRTEPFVRMLGASCSGVGSGGLPVAIGLFLGHARYGEYLLPQSRLTMDGLRRGFGTWFCNQSIREHC